MTKQNVAYFGAGVAATIASLLLIYPNKAGAQGAITIQRVDMTKASINTASRLGTAFAMSCVSRQEHDDCFVAFGVR